MSRAGSHFYSHKLAMPHVLNRSFQCIAALYPDGVALRGRVLLHLLEKGRQHRNRGLSAFGKGWSAERLPNRQIRSSTKAG